MLMKREALKLWIESVFSGHETVQVVGGRRKVNDRSCCYLHLISAYVVLKYAVAFTYNVSMQENVPNKW